jgi:hypothetical protein
MPGYGHAGGLARHVLYPHQRSPPKPTNGTQHHLKAVWHNRYLKDTASEKTVWHSWAVDTYSLTE